MPLALRSTLLAKHSFMIYDIILKISNKMQNVNMNERVHYYIL